MAKKNRKKGQGTLEYLLILAAILAIAVTVIVVANSLLSTPEGQLDIQDDLYRASLAGVQLIGYDQIYTGVPGTEPTQVIYQGTTHQVTPVSSVAEALALGINPDDAIATIYIGEGPNGESYTIYIFNPGYILTQDLVEELDAQGFKGNQIDKSFTSAINSACDEWVQIYGGGGIYPSSTSNTLIDGTGNIYAEPETALKAKAIALEEPIAVKKISVFFDDLGELTNFKSGYPILPQSCGGGPPLTGVNQIPTAVIAGPPGCFLDVPCEFDGSTSTDPENDPLTFEWLLDNNIVESYGVDGGSSSGTWTALAQGFNLDYDVKVDKILIAYRVDTAGTSHVEISNSYGGAALAVSDPISYTSGTGFKTYVFPSYVVLGAGDYYINVYSSSYMGYLQKPPGSAYVDGLMYGIFGTNSVWRSIPEDAPFKIYGSPTSLTDSITHTFTSVGTFLITLTVTDFADLSDTADVYVTVADQPSFAVMSWDPLAPNAGDTVNFDGSASYTKPGSSLVAWEWDFDFDGTFSVDDSGESVSNAYPGGTFVPMLRVMDDEGNFANTDVNLGITVASTTSGFRYNGPLNLPSARRLK